MTRLLLTCTTALVLAAPLGASAATTHRRAHVTHHAMAHHAGMRHTTMRAARVRDGGSAAVDQLNEQSLNRARGTAQ